MTVPSDINRSGPYNGNGVTTVFDYEFKITNENYIRVIKADAAGVETILTLDADYIVSDVGNPAGGQVALTVALPIGQTLTMIPHVPFTQEIDLENQGAYYAETVETGFDLAVMRDQQLQEQINRAVTIPASENPAQLDGLVGDILRLADSADSIDTVANNIGAVNTAASNMAAIIAAPGAATAAAGSADAANKWAVEAEDTPVNDGVHASGFSAFHFMRKALAFASSASASAIAAAASAASIALPAIVANTMLVSRGDASGYDTKTPAQVRDFLLTNKPYNVLWAGADPTNTNDCVAAFVAAEANGDIHIPDGNYKIASNWSPTVGVKIASGAKLYVADGITVNFGSAQPEIHAPRKQRFYLTGTGAVTGLDEAHGGWFAGDKRNTATDAAVDLQKWADSVNINGTMHWPLGYFTKSGTTYTVLSKGQVIKGKSWVGSQLRWPGSETRGFQWTTVNGGGVFDLGVLAANYLVCPTAGVVFFFDLVKTWTVANVMGSTVYRGIQASGGYGTVYNMWFNDVRSSDVYVDNCKEIHVSHSVFGGTSVWLTLTGVTGAFQNNETITFAGGTGTIITDGINYKAILQPVEPATGVVITGSTSGATGTIGTISRAHNDGAVRLDGPVHAFNGVGLEVSGGFIPLYISGASNDAAGRCLANVFTGCFFDSAKGNAVSLANASGTKFDGCWFSTFNSSGSAVSISESQTTTFIGCQWSYVGGRCILAGTNAKDVQVIGGLMADINTSNIANLAAIQFLTSSSGLVRDVTIGASLGYGAGNPYRGVQADSGSTVTIAGVDASLCTTPIVDSATGTTIRDCRGAKTSNQGTGSVAIGAATAVITHGLGFTPAASDIRITPTSSLAASSLTGFWISAVSATTFTVTTNANAAAAAWNFGWAARVKNA